jgi:hypothetical protein
MAWRDIKKYPRSADTCTVYLIHFTKPFRHAQHYIGVTKRNDVIERLLEHRTGRGARICKHAVANGAELRIARVWRGVPRYYEIKLKNRGGAKKWCPVCKVKGKVWKDV